MASKQKVARKKKWTVMIYLSGNNNLAEEMVFAIREMYRVGTSPNFDVVVQLDSGGPPRRFEIKRVDGKYKFPDTAQRSRADQDLEGLSKPVRRSRQTKP